MHYDKKGEMWGTNGYQIDRGELIVKPGGKETDDYWCSGDQFINGYIFFEWIGEDAGGHHIEIQVNIYLR